MTLLMLRCHGHEAARDESDAMDGSRYMYLIGALTYPAFKQGSSSVLHATSTRNTYTKQSSLTR